MEIIPAIDIRGGKCVRLYQGDYSRETVFFEDPVAVASRWQVQGASRLHVVDLDGAASGELQNIKVIEGIVGAVSLPIQLGGGIRREETVERLIGMGINRVILGTVAVENLKLVERLCRKFREAIAVSIDVRDGYVATQGWQRETVTTALKLGRRMAEIGVGRFIYTDIKRDGTLSEPNFEAISELVSGISLPVIAAGGISSISHLEKLKELKVAGAIVGKALYTGDINLGEALKVVDG